MSNLTRCKEIENTMVKASLIDNGNVISLTASVQKLPKKTIKSNLGDSQKDKNTTQAVKNLLKMPSQSVVFVETLPVR